MVATIIPRIAEVSHPIFPIKLEIKKTNKPTINDHQIIILSLKFSFLILTHVNIELFHQSLILKYR